MNLPMFRRRAQPVRTVLSTLALAVAITLAGCTNPRDESTPASTVRTVLDTEVSPIPAGSRLTTGIQAEPGTRTAFGVRVITNEGSGPITIEDISLVELDAGLKLLGILVSIDPDREASGVGGAREFPANNPGANYQDPAGVVLYPRTTPAGENGMEISVGLEATVPGNLSAKGIRVKYRNDGRKYEVVYPDTLRICTPPDPCT